jgi:hypothetical protein
LKKRRKKTAKKKAKARKKSPAKRGSPLAHIASKVHSLDSRLATVESKMFSGKRRNKHGGHSVAQTSHVTDFSD